jgi:hypothetical protein
LGFAELTLSSPKPEETLTIFPEDDNEEEEVVPP